jgi:hypothetical protein
LATFFSKGPEDFRQAQVALEQGQDLLVKKISREYLASGKIHILISLQLDIYSSARQLLRFLLFSLIDK